MRGLLVVVLLAAAVTAAPAAGIELLYSGSAPDLAEGILLIREQPALEQALSALDPPYDGPAIDLDKQSVVRVTGRPRENGCRDTALIEVSTSGVLFTMSATAKVEERVPEDGCACTQQIRPPRAFLVSVPRHVRKAKVETSDAVVPCGMVMPGSTERPGTQAELVFEGAWDGPAGADVIVDQQEYRAVLTRLGIGERGPAVDFEKARVVAVTGRPRENGCRKTTVTSAKVVTPEEAEFALEEAYGAKGQLCAQVMMKPRLFLFRVPATVMRAKLTTTEAR